MAFIGSDSVFGSGNTSVNEVPVDIQSTADRVNDFEHNTVLSKMFEKAGIDWLLIEKRVVSLSKDKITGYEAPQICA